LQGSVRVAERSAKIDGYTLESLLGEGGYGEVWSARDDGGRRAALKIFKQPERTAQQLLVQQNEIEALARLSHPSLVELYSYGAIEGLGLYLAMELADGETLDRYLARVGRLDTIEALRIVRRIAEALAHCHAEHVLHLDLKPGNIVLTDPHEPRLKVLDFGLATLTAAFQAEHARVAAGTVAYLAPECLGGDKTARPSVRMDLYALGTILYELIAGRLPFHTGSVDDVIDQKLEGSLIPLTEVAPATPAPVVALVSELLERDPVRRFGSAARLAKRLKRLYYETLHGVGTSAGEEAPADSGHDEVRFVGRASELSRLEQVVHDALGGAPRPAVVIGDGGTGKSRLLTEMLRSVEQAGAALVAYGRCRELSALVPYSALREALAQIAIWIQRHKGERSTRIQRAIAAAITNDSGLLRTLVPELVDVVGGAPGGDIGPGGPRWVADAIGRVLAAITTEIPVVLALEDLHWGDEATHGVLDRLTDQVGDRPIVFLGTARPSQDRGASFEASREGPRATPGSGRRSSGGARQPWLVWKNVERIDLGPLTPEENAALLDALGKGAGEEVRSTLLRWVPLLGAGNPLFAIQVVKNLEIEGHVRRAQGGTLELSTTGDIDYRPPSTIADVLCRAVDELGADAIAVLGVAALIGRQFVREDLAALGIFDEGAVDRALREGIDHHLCRAEGEAVSFTHDVARELLEATVPEEDRAEHHRRIARRIEERGGDPGTLAHHLDRAGEAARAAAAYLAAAREADRMQDPVGASRRLRRAIALLEGQPSSSSRDVAPASGAPSSRDALLARAAHELARVDCLLGSTTEPLQILKRVAEALPESPLAIAAVSSALARVHYVRGEFADAVANSRKAMAAAGANPSLADYQCAPANILGRALCAAGKVDMALGPLRRGCELAEAAGEHTELCHSRGILCVALSYAGHFAEAEKNGAEAERIARELRDPARLLGTWFYYAVLGEARFDWDLGMRSSAALLAYAEEQGLSGLYLYVGTMYAGRHQFHAGQIARARVLLANARNLSQVLGIGMGRGWAEGYLGDVFFVQGKMDDAMACYARAVEIGSAATGDAYAAGLGLIGKMHASARRGASIEDVKRMGGEALAVTRGAGNRSLLVTGLERLAEALEDLGDAEGARSLREERAALVGELGLSEPSFWPRIPFDATQATSTRDYWSRAHSPNDAIMATRPAGTGSVGERESAATVALTETVAVEASGEVQTGKASLYETLASIENYVPRFERG
jgi:eukaryotic-like serine/threonine-protein kinase